MDFECFIVGDNLALTTQFLKTFLRNGASVCLT